MRGTTTTINRCARALATGAALTALAWGGGWGCTSRQHNEWYFAAAEIPAPPGEAGDGRADPQSDPRAGGPARDKPGATPEVELKFYRVRIDGTSYGGHAKLLTGLYPAKPLHELFGDVPVPTGFPAITPPKDPKNGDGGGSGGGGGDHHGATPAPTPAPDANSGTAGGDGVAAATKAVTEKLRKAMELACNVNLGELNLITSDMRFTVFYGMNADAMADQVKAFAKAEATGNGLARLLLAAGGAGEAKLAADDAKAGADALAKGATETAKVLRTSATAVAATQPAPPAANARPLGADVSKSAVAAAQAALAALGSELKLDPNDPKWPEAAKAAAKVIRDKEGK